MKFTTALVAGLAAVSSAFLIPPEVPEHFTDLKWKGGPPEHVKEFIHALLEGKTTDIELDCPNCPFAKAENDKSILWEKEGIESTIQLSFATQGRSLTLNNHPLLPIEEAQRARTTTIKTHQTRKDTGEQSVEVPLNFAMEVMPAVPSPHKDDVSLIPVEFTVLGLNGIPVKVNTISLKLVQTPGKELVIVDHEEIAFEETPGAETCEGARVWSLCRLRAMILARVKTMVETTSNKADEVQDWVKAKCGGKKTHGMHGKPHGHHHGHHGPHRYHRIGHMLHQTFRFFIIPALLGVIGGLAASAIGMLVGQAIVLMVRFYRRGQRGPIMLIEREIVVVPEEKAELLAEEGLPEYEDAPQYEDIVQERSEPDSRENEKQ